MHLKYIKLIKMIALLYLCFIFHVEPVQGELSKDEINQCSNIVLLYQYVSATPQ